MRTPRWLVLFALVLSACSPGVDGTGVEAPSTSTTPPTVTSTTAPAEQVIDPGVISISVDGLEVIVPPGIDGELPSDLIVDCASGPSFPMSALGDIRPLEGNDPGGVAEAIDTFLSNEEGQFWPQEDWLILHMSEDEMTLVNKVDSGELAYQFLTSDSDAWVWSGASINGNPCDLQYAIPEDLNEVEWRLDPSGGELTPQSTKIDMLLTERECVDGREIGDRLRGPQIVMTETEVMVAFAAVPPTGDYFTCPGNPDTPYRLELPEPLGNRELVADRSIGISLEDYLN